MKVFSIYDGKACAFASPFFMPTIGLALRAFTDLVNDVGSTVKRHPSDYTLFHIGEFDEQKGTFSPVVPHVNLGLASTFLIQNPPVDMLDPSTFSRIKEVAK